MNDQKQDITTKMLPMMEARAEFLPNTIDENARTIDIVFATETPVRKNKYFDGPYNEILVCTPESVNLSRMEKGAPLLDNHNRFGSVTNQLGVVVPGSIRFGKGTLTATVKFSKRELPEEVFKDVKDGIVRNASVGYAVETYEITKNENGPDEYRAIKWAPWEISMTSVPADENSGVRSSVENESKYSVNLINRNSMNPAKGTIVDDTRKVEVNPKTQPATTPVVPQTRSVEEIATEAVQSERLRVTEIESACRAADLGDDFTKKLISQGVSIDQARAAIIEQWKAGQVKPATAVHTELRGEDEVGKRRIGMEAGMSLRSGFVQEKDLTDEEKSHARAFRTMRLEDVARECLIRGGENVEGLGRMDLVGRAFTSSTSDFPVLLEGTIRRVLLSAYEIMPDSWRQFCSVGSVSDFREHKRLRMGGLSRLDKIQENGEFKTKPLVDAEYESIFAETYGNIINVTRKMIINDDLSAFARLASALGRAAARSIEIDVYALFALNAGNGPTMQDGNPLFHASHANIAGSAAVISVESIDAARVQMAQQTDPSGNDFLDLRPSVLICPISMGGLARTINDAQYEPTANQFQKPNIVRGLFNTVVDTPRLSGTAWYALADSNVEPIFEVAFLDGQQSPFMENMEGFTVDGTKWKIRHDYGVGAIGYRGVIKNAGA